MNGLSKNYHPTLNFNVPPPTRTSMIVRKNDQGRWLDDNNGDWTEIVSGQFSNVSNRVAGWDLVDRDIAIIDANNLSVNYQTRLMNMVMAMDVNPVTGELLVVGTDSINEVRYQPNVNGVFVRTHMARFIPGQVSTVQDLNGHLDYSTPRVSPSEREKSIGDPRGVAWLENGTQVAITGMGSNNVLVLNAAGDRVARVDVGQGPTGIKIKNSINRAYVLNKFGGSISVLNTNTWDEIDKVAFFDPTPDTIKLGRPFLYDTHLTSGLGQASVLPAMLTVKPTAWFGTWATRALGLILKAVELFTQ